jgi:hypothetical protein
VGSKCVRVSSRDVVQESKRVKFKCSKSKFKRDGSEYDLGEVGFWLVWRNECK